MPGILNEFNENLGETSVIDPYSFTKVFKSTELEEEEDKKYLSNGSNNTDLSNQIQHSLVKSNSDLATPEYALNLKKSREESKIDMQDKSKNIVSTIMNEIMKYKVGIFWD